VRVLPEGRPQGGDGGGRRPGEGDQVRFGFSQPCVRCLRALDAFGVHRVIFSTGEEQGRGEVGCEVREVTALLRDSLISGHCSRGDRCSVAAGAVRRQECE
jgi:tRNA(Arg) A34 adenosine deaminase TadA